jgi:hypothetical protein
MKGQEISERPEAKGQKRHAERPGVKARPQNAQRRKRPAA